MAKPFFFFVAVLLSCGFSTARADQSAETAVKNLFQEYVLAFNSANIEALEGMWSPDAIYIDHQTGERTVGRERILEDLKLAISQDPNIKLSGKVAHLNVLADNLVSVQGEVAVTRSAAQPVLYRYTAIAKIVDDKWRLHSVEEFPVADNNAAIVSLQDLEWMIGKWRSDGEEAGEVISTVRPAIGGAFLVRSYEVVNEDGESQNTTEIIGVDPRTGEVLIWSFHSDGSFGSGVAAKEGSNWQIRSVQTLIDGSTATGTFVVTRPDADTFTVQLIAHEIDGEPQPAAEPMVMKRVSQE